MKTKKFVFALTILYLLIALPGAGLAWVGVEFSSSLAGIADPYEVTGNGGDGGIWEVSGRVMYQDKLGPFDAELHWLATILGSFGKADINPVSQGSPFRILDLEYIHHRGDRAAILSELDRLSLTFDASSTSIIAGRQAVSWGEAYYYNIEDLFGAFPITETNRLHKPGIDALSAAYSLGPFSDLSFVLVPSDDKDNSAAARLLFPAGKGSLTLTIGSILETEKWGAGYTVDVSGTKLYGACLLSVPEDGDNFTEAVLGAERQVGPYTHVLGELYYNGWGADDPEDYAGLQLTERYLEGGALTLGKLNAGVQISRQMTALLTITPAVFANLSDGSTLLRMDGSYSLSDFSVLTGGVFLGLGDRPDGLEMRSEYGSVPPTLYVEVVHSL
jgi:hypothetical protein